MGASTVEVTVPAKDAGYVNLKSPPTPPPSKHASEEAKWCETANIFEYGAAANPVMAPIPVLVHPPTLHEQGSTRVIPFDINDCLDIDTQCTSPNLMASFVRVLVGESIETVANATSQAFYVIRGQGETTSEHGTVSWSTGDMFVVPVTKGGLTHTCIVAEDKGGAALYWVHDEPLMDYLGVAPNAKKFEPTLFKRDLMLRRWRRSRTRTPRVSATVSACSSVTRRRSDQDADARAVVAAQLHPGVRCSARTGTTRWRRSGGGAKPGVYTLMGKEIDANGDIIDPIRCDWTPGGVFVTPPGSWH